LPFLPLRGDPPGDPGRVHLVGTGPASPRGRQPSGHPPVGLRACAWPGTPVPLRRPCSPHVPLAPLPPSPPRPRWQAAAGDGSDMTDLSAPAATAVPVSAVPAASGLYDPSNDKD